MLNPALYDFLLFRDPSAQPSTFDDVAEGRMKTERVQAILQVVSAQAEIVGFAIIEYLPWSVVKFAEALKALPFLGANPGQGKPA